MGTITKVGDFQDRLNSHLVRFFQYAGPASYATGGDTLTPQSIGLGRIVAITGLVISNGTNVYSGYYNHTTGKILWYSATATEISNATDLSAFTGRLVVFGK
jgi:hypothetical protein